MINRRSFNKKFGFLLSSPFLASQCNSQEQVKASLNEDLIISTWNNKAANETAIQNLSQTRDLIGAIEAGINTVEADPKDRSVGYGGRPDRDGNVTLDACIMDHKGGAGSVTFLKNIKHPVSVARKVMEDTPHVILSGEGAQKFALESGFKTEDLLTESSKKDYEEWVKKGDYQPVINIENHDTIGMIGRRKDGNLSGACSTSGLMYKMQGRVGDSPIIGAGLYVDNDYGAATATGLGEVVIKSCSTFLVVELMRNGLSPEEACKEAVMRIKNKYDVSDLQVGLIAINKAGEYGAYSIQPGFVYIVSSGNQTELLKAKSLLS